MHALMMPRLGQTMTKGKMVEWLVNIGDDYQEGTPVYTIETDKTLIEVEASIGGRLLQKLADADEEIPVGTLVGVSADENETVTQEQLTEFLNVQSANAKDRAERDDDASDIPVARETIDPQTVTTERARAMPNVRLRAKELGVDLDALAAATGKSGLIAKQDVEAFAATLSAGSSEQRKNTPHTKGQQPKGLQAAMARQMSRSWAVPQFSQDMEVDIAPLRQHAAQLSQQGMPVSFSSLVMDALVRSLQAVPLCNATYDNGTLTLHDTINIGMAVAADHGLVVPVLRNCEVMDLAARAEALNALVRRARAGSLTPDDMDSGTVTLSLLNNTRVQSGVPILNAPQVCLLFCGSPAKRPFVDGDKVIAAETIHLVAVYDHRVIDGMTGAKFMDALHESIASF